LAEGAAAVFEWATLQDTGPSGAIRHYPDPDPTDPEPTDPLTPLPLTLTTDPDPDPTDPDPDY